jgi:SSS family solute:Na+ symporter
MQRLAIADWLVITVYLLLSLGISAFFVRKARRSVSDFFLGGRSMPWWLCGISLAATTFAADTPLAVAELVRGQGIAGNWMWWNMLMGGMMTTFFFARLWRRAQALTDIEFVELRYSGKVANYLRGGKAVYFGLVMNLIIMAWVNLAMSAVLEVYFELRPMEALGVVAILMLFTAFYTVVSGLWGVMASDAFQFVVAMVGCVALAYNVLAAPAIGGLEGLAAKLRSTGSLNFFPVITADGWGMENLENMLSLGWGAFIAYACVQWWASWYPGAEPGGGGYVAQRLMAAKDEKNAWGGALFFQFLHYAVRPWPWILVALATLILYPNATEAEARKTFVYAMRDYLPSGFYGLMLIAFFSAYMSTISTHLNWGASYLVNDLVVPFWATKSSERQVLNYGRFIVGICALLSIGITPMLGSIKEAWGFVLECGAGFGLVLLARWYWWRVSAWSELTAMVAPFLCYLALKAINGYCLARQIPPYTWLSFPSSFFIIVAVSTLAWIAVTFLTPPTSAPRLRAFYEQVKPMGFWGEYSAYSLKQELGVLLWLLLAYFIAVIGLYAGVLGIGYFLLGFEQELVYSIVLFCGCAAFLFFLFPRLEKKIADRAPNKNSGL